MKHAVNVGRVGALAVALGVGAVWVSTPGVAWAEDTGKSTSSVHSTKRTSDGGPSAHSGKSGATDSQGSAKEPDDSDGGDAAPAPSDADVDHDIDGDEEVDETEGSDDGPTADDIAEPELAEELERSSGDIDASALDVNHPTATPTAATLSADNDPDPTTTSESSVADDAADAAAPIPVPVTTQPVRLPSPTIGQILGGVPTAASDTVRGVVAIALSPLLIPTLFAPSTPADPPAFWVLLAWARRQLFNSTPRLRPQDAEADATTGEIVGDLGATDADGDPITLAVTRGPAHGTVTIDQETGAYTYTPDEGYTGLDSFVVTVTDSGPDGLFGFLLPGRGHVSAVEISLTVPDTGGEEQPDFVIDSVADNPVWGTGAVRGHVTASGIAELGHGPTRGTVVVNTDGTFTYTPTPIQRVAAAHAEGDVTDAFTVSITSAAGATHAVTVTVPVAMTANALVYRPASDYLRPGLGQPVRDPITGRVYLWVVADSRPGVLQQFVLVAVNPDGSVIDSGPLQPSDVTPKLLINPVTGAGHMLSGHLDLGAGVTTTTSATIAADGSVRSVTAAGRLQGDPVFDAEGNLYFLTSAPESTVVTIVSADGDFVTNQHLQGTPRGLAANPVRNVVYVATRQPSPLTSVVYVLDRRGLVTDSVRVAGSATLSGLVVDDISGIAYLPVTIPPTADGVAQSAVVVHGPAGFVVSDHVDGTAERTLVNSSAADTAYLLLRSAYSEPLIAVVTADGSVSPVLLPGEFRSASFVGDRAVITSTIGVDKYAASILDADGQLTSLGGVLRGVPVVDSAAGRVYVTTELNGIGTVWFIAAGGDPVGVEIAGAAAEGPVRDSAGRILQLAAGIDGRSTLHVFGPDGGSIAEIPLQGDARIAPVVHPTDRTIYLLLSDGIDFSRIVVLDSDFATVAEHVVDGLPAHEPSSLSLKRGARFIPNTVLGGSTVLLWKQLEDFTYQYQWWVIAADGSAQLHELDEIYPTARAKEQPLISPAIGTSYVIFDVRFFDDGGIVDNAARIYSVLPDGSLVVNDDLRGLAPEGGLIADPESGTAYFRTDYGVWIIDVDPERFV